jgi:hypothetical protein
VKEKSKEGFKSIFKTFNELKILIQSGFSKKKLKA